MASRSLNQVQLIGNLTRDPDMRYTPSNTAVCTFGIATNRQWVLESGEKKEDVEFHRIVSWQKLAEICGKYLKKGMKVYVQGRLQTRSWTGQDGQQRQTTEIVIDDMIMLGGRRDEETSVAPTSAVTPAAKATDDQATTTVDQSAGTNDQPTDSPANEDVSPDDIPF